MGEIAPVTIICVTAIVLVVCVCVTILIMSNKLTAFKYSRSGGIDVDCVEDDAKVTGILLENMLGDSEFRCKRYLLSESYKCFKDNPSGQKYAVYIIALNHCLRDMLSIGLAHYESHHQRAGNWNDSETRSFMNQILLAHRVLIDERMESYHKCRLLPSSKHFNRTLEDKMQKNEQYSTMIDKYIKQRGLDSQCNHIHSSMMSVETTTGEQS